MNKNKLDFLVKVFFFGSIWGIAEATLGYALHLLPGFLAGSIMFSIVMLILMKAYKNLGSKTGVFLVAVVAITIKASNLLLPFLPAMKTINPMMAMIFESLLVIAVIPLFDKKSNFSKVTAFFVASIAWRLVFVGYQGVNYLLTDYLASYLSSFELIVEFVLLNGIVSAIILTTMYFGIKNIEFIKKSDNLKIHPLLSFITLVLAFVLTLLL